MSTAHQKSADRLQTLEKWRTAELDLAQVRHAQQMTVVGQNERAVSSAERVIDDALEQVRFVAQRAQTFSADSLARLQLYARVESEKLEQARRSLESSRREADDTRTGVNRRFEALSVVERLQARRKSVARRDSLRVERNLLDDQAVLRSARSATGTKGISKGE